MPSTIQIAAASTWWRAALLVAGCTVLPAHAAGPEGPSVRMFGLALPGPQAALMRGTRTSA